MCEAENNRDLETQLACYGDPLLDHFAGREMRLSHGDARQVLPAWCAATRNLHRDVEEVIATGNRATLRWHLTAEGPGGEQIPQHGCSVIEHDGERIGNF